ncbi:UDP-glycosyltransferase UGT5-like [Tribolium madens]|uniref:UDP-glycosyltransferase UGT5-like n=1 Tax=Tribolium madens TaxID=41895 RepID=UPI001CF71E39|nr:UDP-glycosyltransferase UGT5-like [Tribolium madens]
MYLVLVLVLFSPLVVNSANILGVFMFPSISHQVVYQPIWRELSLRGHNVTVVTPDPLNDPTLTNLTEISVRFAYDILKENRLQDIVSKDANPFETFKRIFPLMEKILEAELESPPVSQLIKSDLKVDLILFECFHPALYGLAGRFKAPIIGVSSLGIFTAGHDSVGNPTHPVLYPDIMLNYHSTKLSIWGKIQTVVYNLWSRYYYHWVVTPKAHELARKYFGEVPYVGDLERNVSMLFLNVNPFMYPPRPNVPTIVEMGQMHIKPPKPLPEDLKRILDGSPQGVVYFSLGSNVKSVNIPETLRRTIMGALSQLPYLVLWKFEADQLPGKPPNVVIRKWLPQQDVLAHPNVRVFVTQGGLQSTEEAISRKVPLVGMPFMGDQPMNVQKIVNLGIGLGVDPATLTEEQLKKSIIEVVENNKYRRRMEEVNKILFDKPMSGLEKAVYWSEYVIRHGGTRHLRSPSADISWFEYLLVDVVFAVVGIVVGVVYFSYKLAQFSMEFRRQKIKLN